MRYFSYLYEIIASKIVNTLNGGDITPRKVIRLAELFSAYLLVLLNKYRGLISIFKVTSETRLETATISTN